jgi:hypothetical protein
MGQDRSRICSGWRRRLIVQKKAPRKGNRRAMTRSLGGNARLAQCTSWRRKKARQGRAGTARLGPWFRFQSPKQPTMRSARRFSIYRRCAGARWHDQDLARPEVCRPARGDARPRRGLFRSHPSAGGGELAGPLIGLGRQGEGIMVEPSGQGEHAFGWTFEVSHQSVTGDRIYESPYHVGIADQGEAKAVLENSITPLEATEVMWASGWQW